MNPNAEGNSNSEEARDQEGGTGVIRPGEKVTVGWREGVAILSVDVDGTGDRESAQVEREGRAVDGNDARLVHYIDEEKLRAERDRFRAALMEIAEYLPSGYEAEIARKALKQTGEK